MTQPAASPIQARGALGRVRKIPILVALVAAFNEAGLNSVAAATAVTLAIPVTASVFVYEVIALRGNQLEREASDRVRIAAPPPGRTAPASNAGAAAPAAATIEGKLDTMLASRTSILDTFGEDASTVAPIYNRIIKQMLQEDDATLARLPRQRDAAVSEKADDLRAIHAKLARLVGP